MSEFEQKDEQEPEDSIGRRRGFNDEQTDEVEGHILEGDDSTDEDDSIGRRRR